MSYQLTTIVGYVGQDATIRYTRDGTAVASFSVATSKKFGKGEDKREETTWWRVTAWREQAETASQYVKKGMLILVDGDVKATAWIDEKAGTARAALELTAHTIKFLSRSDKDADRQPAGQTRGADVRPTDTYDDGDDIPF